MSTLIKNRKAVAGAYATDNTLSSESENAVQNKVIKTEFDAINTKLDNKIDFTDVAFDIIWQGTDWGYSYVTFSVEEYIPQNAVLLNVAIAEEGGASTAINYQVRGSKRVFASAPQTLPDQSQRRLRLFYYLI